MILVLDANAAVAVLFGGEGAAIVSAALLEDEAHAYIHLQNAIEVFYFAHRNGALDACLQLNPQRRAKTPMDRARFDRMNVFDPAIFDAGAGDVAATDALLTLENLGVQIIETMDTDLWQGRGPFEKLTAPRFAGRLFRRGAGVALARRWRGV